MATYNGQKPQIEIKREIKAFVKKEFSSQSEKRRKELRRLMEELKDVI